MQTEDSTERVPAGTADGGPQRWRPKNRLVRWFGRCFYACGGAGLPPEIACLGRRYLLEQVLKHDFHAATGLYRRQESAGGWGRSPAVDPPNAQECSRSSRVGSRAEAAALSPPAAGERQPGPAPVRLICKVNRRKHFCFLPLGLFGRLLTHSEVCNLRRCQGIEEVPRFVARLNAHTYVYEYIEGRSLNENPPLPADFFDRLLAALEKVHARNLVHFDLHKPGNILVDTEGRPHIIDFQISQHIGPRFLLSRRLSTRFRRWLQSYDLYHIYKHKRRRQPQLLTEAEAKLSRNHTLALEIQRAIARPYKKIRRACLRRLYAGGILAGTQDAGTCVETNPVRWTGGHEAAPERPQSGVNTAGYVNEWPTDPESKDGYGQGTENRGAVVGDGRTDRQARPDPQR
jgi:predicted Ser/Thr protein kinase